MTRKMFATAIVLCLFMVASSCIAADLSSSKNSNVSLNSTGNATNSTNSSMNLTISTSNSTNNTLNSANGTLKSTRKDSRAGKSDLWTWGGIPEGYARASDNSLVPEAYLDAQGSVMETPSQAVPNNNAGNNPAGLLVRPT